MMERPIIFSTPMVRAILEGRKAQTRRVLKHGWAPEQRIISLPDGPNAGLRVIPCEAGDLLWVREAHTFLPKSAYALPKAINPQDPDIAAYYREGFDRSGKIIWRPSIHMPRWASRIMLRVTGVKVERLHDITEEDAKAEGATLGMIYEREAPTHRAGFRDLWEGIHGPGSWAANPWVAAITFERAA